MSGQTYRIYSFFDPTGNPEAKDPTRGTMRYFPTAGAAAITANHTLAKCPNLTQIKIYEHGTVKSSQKAFINILNSEGENWDVSCSVVRTIRRRP